MGAKQAKRRQHDPAELKSRVEYINARWLLDNEAGGVYRRFADAIGRHPQQVGAMLNENPTRAIGEKLARTIERAFNRPVGWLSERHDLNQLTPRHHRGGEQSSDQRSVLLSTFHARPPTDESWFKDELLELNERLREYAVDDNLRSARLYLGAPTQMFGNELVQLELTNLLNDTAVLLTVHGLPPLRGYDDLKSGRSPVVTYEIVDHVEHTQPDGTTYYKHADSFDNSVIRRLIPIEEKSLYPIGVLIEHIYKTPDGDILKRQIELRIVEPHMTVGQLRRAVAERQHPELTK